MIVHRTAMSDLGKVGHPLGQNFFLSPIFPYFKNIRWQSAILQRNTKYLLLQKYKKLCSHAPLSPVSKTSIKFMAQWMAADFLPLPPYSSILYYFLLQVIKTITKFWNVIGGDVNEGARAAKTSSGAQFSPPHSSRGFAARFR